MYVLGARMEASVCWVHSLLCLNNTNNRVGREQVQLVIVCRFFVGVLAS